jgi:hypothetical protein
MWIIKEEVGILIILKIINGDKCLKPHASTENIKRDGRYNCVSYVNESTRGEYPNCL